MLGQTVCYGGSRTVTQNQESRYGIRKGRNLPTAEMGVCTYGLYYPRFFKFRLVTLLAAVFFSAVFLLLPLVEWVVTSGFLAVGLSVADNCAFFLGAGRVFGSGVMGWSLSASDSVDRLTMSTMSGILDEVVELGGADDVAEVKM